MSVRRVWALPLVPIYAAVLRLKEALRGEAKRLAWPVVSVGSLSAGGAGKTPVVIALAQMFIKRGWDVSVLSRGYGRSGKGVERVIGSDGRAAEHYGDEPVLIARETRTPVWVGADRFEAGRKAETSGPASDVLHGVHLLDDGFQHRRLARDFDVVLVTAEDLDDTLLPAGNLREPFSALKRADVVVVREDEVGPAGDMQIPFGDEKQKDKSGGLIERLRSWMREGALVWTVRRILRFPAPLFVFGAGLRPVAFCALARPAGFAEMLLAAGCGVVDTIFFDDHHAYGMADIERVVELAAELKATGFVTTEKDAVKLTAAMRERLETVGPLMVVALDVEFLYPERVMRELEGRLA